MEANLLVIIGVLVLAITGFISLAVTLLAVSESLEKRQPSLFQGFSGSRGSRFPSSHGECYDHCMHEAHWDPEHVSECSSACGL
jgi:hypothetical protein